VPALRLASIGLLAGVVSLHGALPEVTPADLPRVPPTPPEQALATFRVKPGFRIELVAAEPLVVSPVAMSFDEDGRLYVIEMRDYSERRPERLGRVRLLEDADGDGRFDKSTVFADGLPWPTAVTCWAGGVFVGATPDILWMKDTTGDGVADEREVIFTGFASDYAPFATNQLNVQALMNSFQWTLDNRIHGATSFSGGKVKLVDSEFTRAWRQRSGAPPSSASIPGSNRREEAQTFRAGDQSLLTSADTAKKGASPDPRPQTPDRTLDLRGRDFSFDPRTIEMRAESGGGQHGMSFDNRGRKFVCSNSDHIQQIVYEDRYAARNPYYTMPSPRVSIAADGPAAEVFRISPDEPWRVLRTQWRVAGLALGPIEGGGRASGYFTGATGVTIYRGDAYGEDFVDNAFIGDAGGNLVHRKKLIPDGIVMRAERPADERNVEFLASTDNWFRPVQFANAPDGCLYIADMYREVIEHPWSLPPNLKQHLDLNSGHDRGRIYRIVPEKFQQPQRRPLRRHSTKALVPLLAHRNGWMRDTVARLIYERQDSAAIPTILAQAHGRTEPPLRLQEQAFARLHGFYVLAGMRRLPEEELVRSLGTNAVKIRGLDSIDMREALQIHALKLTEPFLKNPSQPLVAAVRAQAKRASARASPTAVELQLVFTLGQLSGPRRVELLHQLIDSQFGWLGRLGDPEATKRDLYWFAPAVVNSLGDNPMALVEALPPPFINMPTARDEIIAVIARPVGARARSNEVARIIEWAHLASWPSRVSILGSLQAGLQQGGASLVNYSAVPGLNGVLRGAATNATANGLGLTLQAQDRLSAIRLLGLAPYADARSNLLWLTVHPKALKEYRTAAMAALGQSGDELFGDDVFSVWPQLTPSMRADALGRLLQRPAWAVSLLGAVEARKVQPAELSIPQQAQLRSHRDPAIRERAERLFGRVATAARQSIVDSFQPALTLRGDVANGRKLFQARCATCHKLGSEGHALGPDLATVKSGGKEKLLIAILDPNREVAPNYASYSVETKDGESLSGILASESAGSVTLRMAGGAESVIARANIASMQSMGHSLMPEGLEEGLKPQDLADLMEFVLQP
jgi:putative membrane-bound dehydrogenase-like protein